MARQMCYSVTVSSVEPIEGKDKIGLASFVENGYKVIVDKTTVQPGMVAVYFEVDSILPIQPQFEFLRPRCFKKKLNGFLIKQMKMANQYSTGLLMTFEEVNIPACQPGKDLTKQLGVRKYEPEEDASPKSNEKLTGWRLWLKNFLLRHQFTRWLGRWLFLPKKIRGEFPTQYINKSDEPNIMNNKDYFDRYKDQFSCYITQKIEGQSITVFLTIQGRKLVYQIFGRNTLARDEHYRYFDSLKLEKKLRELQRELKFNSIAIQGEFTSPLVQSGIYKNGQHFSVYKINIDAKTVYLDQMRGIAKKLGLDLVPVIEELPRGFGEKFSSIEELQEYTEHLWFKPGEWPISTYDDREVQGLPKKKNNLYHRAEGIVVCSTNKSQWSFKVKSQAYAFEGL